MLISPKSLFTTLMIFTCSFLLQAQNLLSNGGFEGTYSTRAPSWSSVQWGGAAATYYPEVAMAHTSISQAMRVDTKGTGSVLLQQSVTINSGHVYQGDIWIRSEVPCEVNVYVGATSGSSPYYYRNAGCSVVTTTESWQQVTFLVVPRFDDAETGHRFVIEPKEEGITIYVDDASLTDVTTSELAELGASLPTRLPIAPHAFGMHINKGHEYNWPSVGQKLIRLWDSGTTWALIEPTKGNFNWTRFDLYMNQLIQANAPDCKVLYCMGMSPAWNNSLGSSTRPPDNIQDWEDYVRAVVQRYKGRIHAYEIWNEVNYSGFYTGTNAELVALAEAAYAIIKEEDPAAMVLTPNFTSTGLMMMDLYLKSGGGAYADGFAFHLYYKDLTDTFHTQLPALAFRDVVQRAGYGDWPLLITETAPIGTANTAEEAEAGVAQGIILNQLFGSQLYPFYFWEGDNNEAAGRVPLSLADHQTLTPGGVAYQTMANWLVGSRMRSFSNLLTETAGEATTVSLDRGPGYGALLAWSRSGAQSILPPDADNLESISSLDGSSTTYTGGTIDIGPSPLLLTYASAQKPNLIGQWDAEMNSADHSIFSHDGTPNGISYITGKDGQAFSFTSNSSISIPSTSMLEKTTELSVSCWYMQPTTTSTYDQYLVAKGSFGARTGFMLYLKSGNQATFRLYDGSNWGWVNAQISAPSATANEWHHLTATYDGSIMKLYLDGNEAAEKTLSNYAILSDTSDLKIGGSFTGGMDHIQIHNTALTAQEVQTEYAKVGHWTFDTLTAANAIADGAPDGAISGNITVVDQSFHFDQSSPTQVTIPRDTCMETDAFSIAFKINNEVIFHGSATTYITFLSKSSWTNKTGFLLMGHSSGELIFRTYDGTNWGWMNREISFPFVIASEWTDMVITCNPTHMKLYLNGTLIRELATSGSILHSLTNDLAIGPSFNGLIDDVTYYASDLSDRQVEWLHFNCQ